MLTFALPLEKPRSLRKKQGGVSGSIAKTATAPIERVKLLIQTQDANPRVRTKPLPCLDSKNETNEWVPL